MGDAWTLWYAMLVMHDWLCLVCEVMVVVIVLVGLVVRSERIGIHELSYTHAHWDYV